MNSIEPVAWPPVPVAGLPDRPVQYGQYVELLSQLLPGKGPDQQWYLYYASPWERLWDLKRGFFSESSLVFMIMQLLTGCRYKALQELSVGQAYPPLTLSVPSVKGSLPSVFSYSYPPPSLTNLLSSRRTRTNRLSYWQYRRELLHANPGFFSSFPRGHLGATHTFRYFFIQVLHYVCQVPLAELQLLLGWRREDSIESYIDPKIFLSSPGVHYEC
ncbi:hypothetical protein ES705_32353 [subsurface metagenome]